MAKGFAPGLEIDRYFSHCYFSSYRRGTKLGGHRKLWHQ